MQIPEVIYKDPEFLVINKPYGLLVHKTNSTRNEHTITEWLIKAFPETKKVGDDPELRPGIIHRLDKATSGVMLIARTQDAFEYFKKQFQGKKIIKKYSALVWGKTEERGVIDKPIGLKPGTTRRVTRGKNLKMVKDALTEYRRLEVLHFGNDTFTLLSVLPKTGRTHQIRVHLQSLHHPIVGDPIYSSKLETKKAQDLGVLRLFLHATSLEFSDLHGKRLTVEAVLPSELEQALVKFESGPAEYRGYN